MIYYFDASAVVKLVVDEDYGDEMHQLWQDPDVTGVSSALLKQEVLSAVSDRDTRTKQRAQQVLATFGLVAIDDPILELAATLDPSVVQTWDAIHVATALSVGDDLLGVVTYDDCLAHAAASQGLQVLPAA